MNKFLLCALLIILFMSSALAEAARVTEVTLDKQNITLTLGGVLELPADSLYATIMPEYATNRNLTWNSNNSAVATISTLSDVGPSRGFVNGISPGIAIITATTQDGGFRAVCTVTVIMSDIQRATRRYSSDLREVAAKMPGFSENDFEIVDGNVVINKSIAETIAKELLETEKIEIFPLPWFEAEIIRGGQNGKTAVVNEIVSMSLFEYPVKAEELLLLSITSPETGEFLKYAATSTDYDDGKFASAILLHHDGINPPDRIGLHIFIRDGGRFDLDKTENGLVVAQLVIVGVSPEREVKSDSGGGCNASYSSITLLLSSLMLFVINRKKK